MLGHAFEEFISRVRLLKRDAVAQGLGRGEDLEEAPGIFGQVIAKDVAGTAGGLMEVVVVEDGVLDAGLAKRRDQGLLPHPLGQPHPSNASVEMLFKIA